MTGSDGRRYDEEPVARRGRGARVAGRAASGDGSRGARTPRVTAGPPVSESLPRGLVIAAAWSWRLLVVGAAAAAAVFLVIELRLIVIPVLIAVLVAALLVPYEQLLTRHGWPRWLSIVTAMLTLVLVVAGLLFLAVFQVGREFHELRHEAIGSVDAFRSWLSSGPLQLSKRQIDEYVSGTFSSFQMDSRPFITGALSVGTTLGHLFAGLLLALFSTLFILIDGKGIWAWVVRVFPRRARPAVDGAGRSGWTTLQNFVRVQILVASIDAVGIGLGALILGLPLVAPIAVLVFLGSFIPIVGAVVTGALAIFVALVFKGWFVALIMLAVVLAVQQLEGHVLQPLIMGSAVKVHPLAVVLVVAAGSFLAGIAGALFAVPLAAVLNVMVQYIAGGTWRRPTGAYPPAGMQLRTALWQTVPRRPRPAGAPSARSDGRDPQGTVSGEPDEEPSAGFPR
jgi:predicted PurR-regulated permease PerM